MTSNERTSVAQVRALLAAATGERLRVLVDSYGDDDREGVRNAVEVALRRESAREAERSRLERLYALERTLRAQGYVAVAGVDEVGRGALAGPLTAGACILPSKPRIRGLDDSKKLSAARREELAVTIRETAIAVGVGHVTPGEVDSLGVTAALKRAMGRALCALSIEPDHVVLDGLPLGIAERETAVVKADASVAAVSAASIVAKVERDALMCALAESHPQYAFEVNKGYGTPEHLAALAAHGACEHHRVSFTPGGGTDRLF